MNFNFGQENSVHATTCGSMRNIIEQIQFQQEKAGPYKQGH